MNLFIKYNNTYFKHIYMGQKLAVLQQVPQTRSKEKPAWKGNPPNKKTAQGLRPQPAALVAYKYMSYQSEFEECVQNMFW
jgi:hypothetical protein